MPRSRERAVFYLFFVDFFATLAGLASVKMMLDASETYTVLNTYRDQQHIQFSQHFMPRLARTRLAKTRKSDLNLKLPLVGVLYLVLPVGFTPTSKPSSLEEESR